MSSDSDAPNGRLHIEYRELVGLYLFLREREGELDTCLEEFYARAEQELYKRLSIAEMEQLRHRYHGSSEK